MWQVSHDSFIGLMGFAYLHVNKYLVNYELKSGHHSATYTLFTSLCCDIKKTIIAITDMF